MNVYGIFINSGNPAQSRVSRVHVTVDHPVHQVQNKGKVRSIDFNPTRINHAGQIVDPLDFPKKACATILEKWEAQQRFWDSILILTSLPIGIGWSIGIMFGLLIALIFSLGGRGFWGFQPFRVNALFLLPGLDWTGLIIIGGLVTILSFVSSRPCRSYLFNKRWWGDLCSYHRERCNRETFFREAYWKIKIDGLPKSQVVEGPSAGLAFFFAFLDAAIKARPECKALFWYLELERWIRREHGNQFVAVGEVTSGGQVKQVGVNEKLETHLNDNLSRLAQNQSRIDLLLGAKDNRREWQIAWERCNPGGNLSSDEVGNDVWKAEDGNATEKVTFYLFSKVQDFFRYLTPPYHWKWGAVRIAIFITVAVLLLGAISGPSVPSISVRIPDAPSFQPPQEQVRIVKMRPSNDLTRIIVQSGITVTWRKPQLLGCLQVVLWSFEPTLSKQQNEELEGKISTKLCRSQERTFWFTMPSNKDQVEVFITATDLVGRKEDRKYILFKREGTLPEG